MSNKKTETAVPKAIKPEKAAQDDFCVYIGPTIQGVIQGGTIFKSAGEIPRFENPLIKNLIVSGNELPEARKKVKMPGNLLNEYAVKLASGQKN